jgi:hypothetical protein
MRKTPFSTIDIVSVLLGDTDTGSGVPRPLPGHVEDRLASMGSGAAKANRRRFSRRRDG